MIKLKPCKYCGGEGIFKRVGDKKIFRVICRSCGRTCGIVPKPHRNGRYYRIDAANDWNKRE